MPALGSVNTRNFKTAKGRKPEYALQIRTADNKRHRVVPSPNTDGFRNGVTRQSTSSGQNTVHAREYTVPFLASGTDPIDHTYFAPRGGSDQYNPATDSIRFRIAIRLQRNDYWNTNSAFLRLFSAVFTVNDAPADEPYLHITPQMSYNEEEFIFTHYPWQTNGRNNSRVVGAGYIPTNANLYDYAPILKPGALIYMEYMIGDPTNAYQMTFRIWSPDMRDDITGGVGYWEHSFNFTNFINNNIDGTISGPVGICMGSGNSGNGRDFDLLGAWVTRYRYDFNRGSGSLSSTSTTDINNEFMTTKFSLPDSLRNNLRQNVNNNHTVTDLFVLEANEFSYDGTYNKNKADFSVLSEYVDVDNPFRLDSDHNAVSGQDVELCIYDASQEMRDYLNSLGTGTTYIHFKVVGRIKERGFTGTKYFYCYRSGGSGRSGRQGGPNSIDGAGPYASLTGSDHLFINLIRSGGSSGTMETLDRIYSIQFAEYNFTDSVSDDPRGPVWYSSQNDSTKHTWTGHNIPTRALNSWAQFNPANGVRVNFATVADQRFGVQLKNIPGADTVIAGHPFAPDSNSFNTGIVYLYQTSGARTTRQTLDGVGGRENDYFGWSVTGTRDEVYFSTLNGEATSGTLGVGRVTRGTTNTLFPTSQQFSPTNTANDQYGIVVKASPDGGILLVLGYSQNTMYVYTDGNHFDGTSNFDRLQGWFSTQTTRTHTSAGSGAITGQNRLGFSDFQTAVCNTHYAFTDFTTEIVYVYDKAGNLAWSHDFSGDGTTNTATANPITVNVVMNETYTLISNPAWQSSEGKIRVYYTSTGALLYQSDNDPLAFRGSRWGEYLSLSENGRYFSTAQMDGSTNGYVFIVETQTGRIADRLTNPNQQTSNTFDGFGTQTVIKEYGWNQTEASIFVTAPFEETNLVNSGYLYRFI